MISLYFKGDRPVPFHGLFIHLTLNDHVPPQPEAAPLSRMDIFSQPDIRPERLKIALISQLILSPAFSDADPAELVKRVDEVWQIVYCTADQGEAEGDIFSLLAGPLIVRGGLKDERVWGHGVLSHHLCIIRDGSLKDIGIDTPVSQETVPAFLASNGTDGTPEGMAEPAAEGGAGVGRQRDRGLAPGRKDESGKVEFFQAAAPSHLQVYEQPVNKYTLFC